VPGQFWSFGSVLVEFMARQGIYVHVPGVAGEAVGRFTFDGLSAGIEKLCSFPHRSILQSRRARRENCYFIGAHSASSMGSSFLKLGA